MACSKDLWPWLICRHTPSFDPPRKLLADSAKLNYHRAVFIHQSKTHDARPDLPVSLLLFCK